MKNKKLFAILTLVCFMFTLMPVAAFATPAEAYLTVGGQDDSISLEATTEAAIAVVNPAAEGYYFFMLDAEGDVVGRLPLVDNTTRTSYSLDLDNFAGGTYNVYAVKADAQVTAVLDSAERYADKIDTLFDDHSTLILNSVALKVRSAETNYNVSLDAEDNKITIQANNGFKGGVVTATVAKTAGAKVKDAKLSFSTVGFVTVTPIDQVTDRNGEAKFQVAATKAGDYKVYVTYGDDTEVLDVHVDPVSVANVAVSKAPAASVALDSDVDGVEFKFTDANGSAFGTEVTTAYYNLTLVSKPADSALKTGDIKLTYDATKDVHVLDGVTAADDFDAEGEYTFKVALANGKSATATVSVKEFDKTVGIIFVQESVKSTVAYDGKVEFSPAAVRAIDANGVTKAATGVTMSVSGKAVKSFTTTGSGATLKYVLEAKDDDYIGQTITVYAVWTEATTGKTFTASHNVTVIDEAATIEYVSTAGEVGVNNVLYANILDASGTKVTYDTVTAQAIVLEKPENAIVVADAEDTLVKGQLKLNLLASVAGEYKIQTIITTADNKYISSIDTFVVGTGAADMKEVVVVSIGADSMIVGNKLVALDVAPYIENNRTMMQYNVLGAFGITVEWNGVNGVTAEGNGTTVELTIGSKVAKVNGAEVALDVAPQIVNDRTVVPVGFITGTFGITPTFTYNADGSIADILFTK